jgi:hypothetical protein
MHSRFQLVVVSWKRRGRGEKEVLESYPFASLNLLLGFDSIFWGEKVERTAIVSLAVLIPQSPSREIGEVLSTHFGQLERYSLKI